MPSRWATHWSRKVRNSSQFWQGFFFCTFSQSMHEFHKATFKQKILLKNFLLSKNEQDTSHKLYMWHSGLAGNLILVSTVLLCSVSFSTKALWWALFIPMRLQLQLMPLSSVLYLGLLRQKLLQFLPKIWVGIPVVTLVSLSKTIVSSLRYKCEGRNYCWFWFSLVCYIFGSTGCKLPRELKWFRWNKWPSYQWW